MKGRGLRLVVIQTDHGPISQTRSVDLMDSILTPQLINIRRPRATKQDGQIVHADSGRGWTVSTNMFARKCPGDMLITSDATR